MRDQFVLQHDMLYLGGFEGREETLQLESPKRQMFFHCDAEPYPSGNATQSSADLFPVLAENGTLLGQIFPA